MKILFIITSPLKPTAAKLYLPIFEKTGFISITTSEKMYTTYPEAEEAILTLSRGIYQIQKIFINEN